MQLITRKFEMDSGHRVMNESMKCFSAHGHRYIVELTYSFKTSLDIGYPIDFKEIKRVACQFLDDYLDHGFLVNPLDVELIETLESINTKLWFMSLNGSDYCNPTVENITKEVFMMSQNLLDDDNLKTHEVKIYETPNCWSVGTKDSISTIERDNFLEANYDVLANYKKLKGVVEYDDRKK